MLKNPAFYKVLFISLLIIIVFLFFINFIYKSIHREHWIEQDKAIKIAFEQSELVSINHVEPFTFEESYMILFGKDAEGAELIVWVRMDEEVDGPMESPVDDKNSELQVHSEYATNGVNKNLLRLKMQKTEPEVHILKMTPGKYKDDWVWEVLYKKSEKEKRTYYDYYRFSDGTLLQTLTMSVR